MSLDGGYTGSLDQAIANLHIGRNQGYKQGFDEGYAQGFAEGQDLGYRQGWDAGIARGNEGMIKQLGYTRDRVAEKEQVQAQLDAEIAHYNAILMFALAAESSLRYLLGEDTSEARHLRQSFAGTYNQLVTQALKQGLIKVRPELDPKLQRSVPSIHRFIVDNLQAR